MPVNPVTGTVDRWLARLSRHADTLLIAVSGGSDSLALLLALHHIASYRNLRLSAATVDHGLRPEAAYEAQYVARLCADLGISHAILKVDWKPGEVPSQSRARAHRYDALARHARHIGASLIVTGHTLNDQVETFLLRQRAGSSWWGLAGMAAETVFPRWPLGNGLTLGRPQLNVTRSQLRAYLTDQDMGWIDDPSNENNAFERVRIRQTLNEGDQTFQEIAYRQRTFALLRDGLAATLLDWTNRYVRWYPGGGAEVDAKAFNDLGTERQLRLFQHLLPCISGQEKLPRQDALLEIISSGVAPVTTLAGCRLSKDKTDILICPELPASDEEIVTGTGIWQGRVQIEVKAPPEPASRILAWRDRAVPDHLKEKFSLPFNVRKTLPVLVSAEGKILVVPHLDRDGPVLVTDLAPERLKHWLSAKSV